MINLAKDKNGIININNLNVNIDAFYVTGNTYRIFKDNELYYFKVCDEKEAFREVFACEFADRYKIEHANYDVASLDSKFGVLSTSIHGFDEEFIPLTVVSNKLNIRNSFGNSIESMDNKILNRLCFFNKKEELIKYIRMFVFDILLANGDRHEHNTGFIKNGRKFRLAPLFDNGSIVCNHSICEHNYSESVTNKKYDFKDHGDVIEEFLTNKKYSDYLVEELDKYSLEDLIDIVDEINKKYPFEFDKEYEEFVLKELDRNLIDLMECKDRFYKSKSLKRG